MTETMANGYSSESTQRELFNEYQHDRVWVVFKNLCVLVLWTRVATALKGVIHSCLQWPSMIYLNIGDNLFIEMFLRKCLKER